MRYFYLMLFILSFLGVKSSFSQSITGIDFNDRNQYSSWLEGQDSEGSYNIKEDVGVFKEAIFRNNVLKMRKQFAKQDDFNTTYLELVTGYGEPTYFKDKDKLKKTKKKDEYDQYYPKDPNEKEVEDNRDVETMVQDGDMTFIRVWEFSEYKINLTWDKEGLLFTVTYL